MINKEDFPQSNLQIRTHSKKHLKFQPCETLNYIFDLEKF